jgi:RNA polymerase sigma-70 factor (ECF subfamily)
MKPVRGAPQLHVVTEARVRGDERGEPTSKAPQPEPPSDRADEQRLIAALRRGEGDASDEFFDRILPRVEGTIRRILGGRDREHDDLVQLAMLELVTSVDRFRGDCSVESWAASVTAHVVFNHLRRRSLERRIFSAAELPPQIPAHGSVGRSIVARDILRRLRRLLDEMDPDRAWAFVLHDVCGFELREISNITGASESAAQSRLVRGRRELNERIAADPELAAVRKNMEGEA